MNNGVMNFPTDLPMGYIERNPSKSERRAIYAGAALTGLLAAATAGSVIDPEGIARNALELAEVMIKVEDNL